MSKENGSIVALELARAKSSLGAASMLLTGDLRHDAVSRAYYAMFHAATALLASIGRTARTHDGLRALVAEHFVRPGLLASHHARALARTAGDRADADYNVAAVFEAEDVLEDIEAARAFILAVEALVERSD